MAAGGAAAACARSSGKAARGVAGGYCRCQRLRHACDHAPSFPAAAGHEPERLSQILRSLSGVPPFSFRTHQKSWECRVLGLGQAGRMSVNPFRTRTGTGAMSEDDELPDDIHEVVVELSEL